MEHQIHTHTHTHTNEQIYTNAEHKYAYKHKYYITHLWSWVAVTHEIHLLTTFI